MDLKTTWFQLTEFKLNTRVALMKIFTQVTLWLFFLLLGFGALQGQQENNIIRCETVEANAALKEQYPQLETPEEFERWLAPRVRKYYESSQSRSVMTLPVIFHIIHDGSEVGQGANVASNQVYAQIEQINNDFRRKMRTSGYNDHPDGADIEIEFCPAYFGPEGQPLDEPGISRIDRNAMGWPEPPFTRTYIESFIKPESQFDPEQYINIWVLDMQSSDGEGTVLGYSQFPSMSGLDGVADNAGLDNTDGVAVAPFTIGSTTQPNTTGILEYGKGRSLTHELGHFFGLRHIWGDGGCGVDDYCADTPASDAPNTGCTFGHISCGTFDMIENYMDYTDDDCMNVFTSDQKARMITVMINSPRRKSLLNSSACLPLPNPNFTADKMEINTGDAVQFTDLSSLNPTYWEWTFEGGTPANSTLQHPVVTYSTPGVYAVTLKAGNAQGENTLRVEGFIVVEDELVCSEGIQDFPYAEPLDGSLGLWSQSAVNDIDWTISAAGTPSGATGPSAPAQGSHYYYLEASANAEKVGILESPCFDFSALSSALLSFQYHMLGRTMGSLEVQVSTDMGNHWTSIWFRNGEQAGVWSSAAINLDDYAGESWVGFRIVGTIGSAFLSDMAIDDIVISGVDAGPTAPVANFTATQMQVKPGESIHFTDVSTGTPIGWLWNFEGGYPTQSTLQHPVVTYVTPGSYAVSLTVTNEGGEDTMVKEAYITVLEEDSEPAGCENGVQAFPYAESFENGLGDWTQNTDDNINWVRLDKNTPSTATGPESAAEGKWYLYTEASGDYNSHAILTSPCIDLTELGNARFEFQFHMFGNNMGTLSVEASVDNGTTWTSLWSRSGDQGNSWKSASVDLVNYIGQASVLLRIIGHTGNGFRSDIAIDELSITTSNGGDGTPPLADFSADTTYITAGSQVQFADHSDHQPSSWSWTFEGGSPQNSTEQHPLVTYSAPGRYSVTLTVSNAYGNDIVTKTGFITVIDGSDFCLGGIQDFPYAESFETGMGGWTQAGKDDFDWTRNRLGTPSSVTGPTAASNGEWYLYTESSLNYNNTSILESPCFDFSNVDFPVFTFDYHMFGENMGQLRLEISINNGQNWSTLWQLSGNRGNNWQTVSIDLPNYGGEPGVRLRFAGTTGDSYRSDLAIDHIKVEASSENPAPPILFSEPLRVIHDFSFTPNPTNRELNIHYESPEEQNAELIITDLLGRQLKRFSWSLFKGRNRKAIEVGELRSGTFLLVIKAGKDLQSKRFVKID